VLFLQSRTHATDTATLLSTGSGGWIRAWSMFGGGLAGEFMASNNHRESILCMTSDENNDLLMTGDTQGYIKVWNISKYCIQEDNDKGTSPGDKNRSGKLTSGGKTPRHVTFSENKPRRKVCGKAPPLVFCLRAHLQPIISIDFVSKCRLLITASTDCSLRLWRSNGQYVGTFGQRNAWNLKADGDGEVPFDLQRAASANSMRLMQSTSRKRWSIAKSFMQVAGRLNVMRSKQGDNAGQDRESSATKSAALREAECRIDMNNILGKLYEPRTRHSCCCSL
jgi:WD40 repeat protein